LSLSKALVGFLNTKAAEGLSPRTLTNYEFRLNQWIEFTGDAAVESVTPQDIRKYLMWLNSRAIYSWIADLKTAPLPFGWRPKL